MKTKYMGNYKKFRQAVINDICRQLNVVCVKYLNEDACYTLIFKNNFRYTIYDENLDNYFSEYEWSITHTADRLVQHIKDLYIYEFLVRKQ